MTKPTLLLLFAIGANFIAKAQPGCPNIPWTLTTQAQVNAFPNTFPDCTYLNVRFEIAGSGITNLTPLSQLTGTSKNFYVNFNTTLPSLSGLDNITEVLGDLTIQANHSLLNLEGMGGLVNAPALLKVENNNNLQTLEGLTAGGVLTTVGSLVIIENDDLTDLSNVLDALGTVAEYVYIQDNASLPTLNTMNNLFSIGWYLNIENLPSLTELNAFNSLQSVGLEGPPTAIDLEVINCPLLETLNDFSSLSELGRNFELSGNTSLTEMSFPSLTSIGGELSITGNTSLTSLLGLGDFTLEGPLFILNNSNLPECEADGICTYLEVPANSATIGNNDPDCNNRGQVEVACLALPVKLISFQGKEHNGEVLLHWQTASEENNDHFQVEHSTDGNIFIPAGKVTGNGTVDALNNYSFRHVRPSKGANYYRLKQVDFDGNFTYSSIVHIEMEHGVLVEIYPNPTSGFVQLKGDLEEGAARLLDITGRPIVEKQLPDQRLFDLTQQPKGVYIIEIQMGNEIIVKRVVKE